MPTNLPPECIELEKKYREAKTLPEKIKSLEKYINSIPSHKGTMRLRAHLKTKLATFRDELEAQKHRQIGAGKKSPFDIRREGAAQVIILGLTQSGKSTLLTALTNAKVEVGYHPYATLKPNLGMMNYEDIQIQIIDPPAVVRGASQGKAWGQKVLGLARNSDGIICLVSADENLDEQLDVLLSELRSAGIYPEFERVSKIEIEKTSSGGIKVFCARKFQSEFNRIKKILLEEGIDNAMVKIWGDVTEEDVKKAISENSIHKPILVVINKIDQLTSNRSLDAFIEKHNEQLKVVLVSAKNQMGIEELKSEIFNFLNIMRIYTRRPGQREFDKPIIMRKGSKILDVSENIHSDFQKNFRFAKIWGPSAKYPGERVGLDLELKDKTIVEIYTK
jgi:small GTP-binding protein